MDRCDYIYMTRTNFSEYCAKDYEESNEDEKDYYDGMRADVMDGRDEDRRLGLYD